MNRSSIKIAIPFLCLLYCFAFFEIDVPGYTQTFHDAFDTYVHQQQDDSAPSPEFHFSYFPVPVGFSVTADRETPYVLPLSTDADGFSSRKLYLRHAVLLI